MLISTDLTARQLDVLRGIAEGKSAKVIARELGLSQRTVDVHTAALFVRLQVKRRSQAAAKAIELGLT
jgi:DNA-binding NarL/FixJ family response regulator